MTIIYVRSTDGNNANDGSTWALAKADLAGAAAIAVAGDTVYVSQAHAESTAADITITWAGTAESPVNVICANDAAEPPTAVAATATVTTTGTSNISIAGHAYTYGIIFQAGSGSISAQINCSNANANVQRYESCKFRIVGTNTGGAIRVCVGDQSRTFWKNCDVRFANASQKVANVNGPFRWDGGSLESGGTSPANLFQGYAATSSRGGQSLVSGVDLTNADAGVNLAIGSADGAHSFVFRNMRLPASWSGSVMSGSATTENALSAEMWNCDGSDTNGRWQTCDNSGFCRSETTIVRTGGASSSMCISAAANAEYPLLVCYSPEIVKYNSAVGGALTLTVEVVHDSQGSGTSGALTDAEAWLEVQYLGTSGVPLGSFITDAKASFLASAADQTSSSETWTTTGLTTPVKQKLAVTFTPQEAGYIHALVAVAKASAVVYADRKITVS